MCQIQIFIQIGFSFGMHVYMDNISDAFENQHRNSFKYVHNDLITDVHIFKIPEAIQI